jgi:UDP-GlcNAc:undecaprenyl-phosphate GlcNAc-1-phosphate transferase
MLLPAALSLFLALVLTPLVRALARRWGVIARPKSDRWHKQPTALLGGIAIFVPVLVVRLALGPPQTEDWAVWAGSACLFLVGLVDDLFHIRPYQKLLGQLLGAALVIGQGLSVTETGAVPLDVVITLLWIVGITNALNLLDNMDGLAGGIAAIAAAFLAAHFQRHGQSDAARDFAVMAAALVGFLVFNTHPASIFMGDCGALFIGFFLAAGCLPGLREERTLGAWRNLLVPILILAVPIFDTTLVSILRKLSGRAISQGGRDHSSHRLVAWGLSERMAVCVLYGLAVVSGGLAMLMEQLEARAGLAVCLVYAMALLGAGVFLARVPVYRND